MDQPLPEVKISEGITNDDVKFATQSRIFREWYASLDNRFQLVSIRLQAVDYRGNNKSAETVLFVRMVLIVNDKFARQIVELRGGTVIMLPILRCDGIDYTVLVKQARIASGEFELVEMPAGMLDNGNFRGAAAAEIGQELELTFTEDELVDLTEEVLGTSKGILLTPGLLDEHAKVYLASRDVTPDELEQMQGKATGLREEGENITLWVVPLCDLHRLTRDAKVFIALALYNLWKGA